VSDYYIGRTACGCVECAVVIECRGDTPQAAEKWRRTVARDIADWIRRGYSIERVSVEYVRENLAVCTHKPQRPGAPRQEEMAP
jgi:hypothetical protein